MKSAYFTIGSRCNHRCVFCPCKWEKRDREIELSVFKEKVDEIEANPQIDSIILSGGEPTIQKNFLELLAYLSHTRLRVRLLTNADRLSDPDMAKRVEKAISPRQMELVTAIHSYNEKIHESITGCAGSFERTNQGLHNMIRAGYRVILKFCISKINYKDMSGTVSFIYENFPDSVSLSFCSIDYCGRADENDADCAVEFQEMREYLEDALDRVGKYTSQGRKRNIIVTNTPLCCVDPAYWKYFICESKNDMAAFLPLPGEEKTEIKYNSKSESGTFFNACRVCDVEKYCAGAWYSAYKLFGEKSVTAIKIR